MHEGLEKCACGDNRLLGVIANSKIGNDPAYLPIFDNKLVNLALLKVQVGLLF